MNKEYIYLSSDEMLIIDENGKPSKRKVENNNMHELLQAENKVERIDERIKNIEWSLNHNIEFSSYSKKDKILTCLFPLIPVAITVGFCAFFGGLNFSQILYSAVPISTIASYSFFGGLFLIDEKQKIKRNKGLKCELVKAYELKESYESRLSSIKSKVEEKKIEVSHTKDIVSLEESMMISSEDQEQLIEAYEQGYGPRAKKLMLRK